MKTTLLAVIAASALGCAGASSLVRPETTKGTPATPEIPERSWKVGFIDQTAARSEYLVCQRLPSLELTCFDLETFLKALKKSEQDAQEKVRQRSLSEL